MERGEYEAMHRLEGRMWWYRGLRALVCERLGGPPAGERPLLDAGCGTGGMLQEIRTRLPAWRCLGIEYDFEAARLAAAKSRSSVGVGSVERLPLADGTLGAIVCLDVLSHRTVTPALALAEFARCLESGGILLLNLPAYGWMLSAHDRRVHNARRFNRAEAYAALTAAGFRVTRASYWNTLLFPLIALRRVLGRDAASSDVQEYPPLLDRLFSAALALERRVIGAGLDLPFGASLMMIATKN